MEHYIEYNRRAIRYPDRAAMLRAAQARGGATCLTYDRTEHGLFIVCTETVDREGRAVVVQGMQPRR